MWTVKRWSLVIGGVVLSTLSIFGNYESARDLLELLGWAITELSFESIRVVILLTGIFIALVFGIPWTHLWSMIFPSISVTHVPEKHRFLLKQKDRTLYRISIRNRCKRELNRLRVTLVSLVPLSGDINEVSTLCQRLQGVPLFLTHDGDRSNPTKIFSIPAEGEQEVDVVSMPNGEGPLFHIQHCVAFENVNGEWQRNPDPRIPRGDYLLTISVAGDTIQPYVIQAEIKDAGRPVLTAIQKKPTLWA